MTAPASAVPARAMPRTTPAASAAGTATPTAGAAAPTACSPNGSPTCWPARTARLPRSWNRSRPRWRPPPRRSALSSGSRTARTPGSSPRSPPGAGRSATNCWTSCCPNRNQRYIRQLLVHTGVLDERDEDIERVPGWLEHAARGQARRRTRTSSARSCTGPCCGAPASGQPPAATPPPPTATCGAGSEVALEFLAWTGERGTHPRRSPPGARRPLDRRSAGRQRRYQVRYFLNWTAGRRLTRKLTVPAIPRQQPQTSSRRRPAGSSSSAASPTAPCQSDVRDGWRDHAAVRPVGRAALPPDAGPPRLRRRAPVPDPGQSPRPAAPSPGRPPPAPRRAAAAPPRSSPGTARDRDGSSRAWSRASRSPRTA